MNTTEFQKKVHELIGAEYMRLTSEDAFGYLTEIYGDVREELCKRAADKKTLIDTYTELMAKEQELYSPDAACRAGQEAAQTGLEYNPLEYIKIVLLEPENKLFLRERDNLFYILCDLLGETHGMMEEYNEAFRECHGIFSNKVDTFYHFGYYGHMPNNETNTEPINPHN